MPDPIHLLTPRLLLRPWQDRDREPFAMMNADPIVMRFYAAPMTRQQSDEAIDRYRAALATEGFSFLAAELRATGAFAGVIGLQTMRDTVPGLQAPVEIGWRLGQDFHGQGLATEGAHAIVDLAFARLHLPQLVAVTVPINTPSRRVMEKLGMTYRPEPSFDHPRVPPGHPYRHHVLYNLSNPRTPTS